MEPVSPINTFRVFEILYLEKATNPPIDAKDKKPSMHWLFDMKYDPQNPKNTIPRPAANPSIPSIKLYAFIIRIYTNTVKAIPTVFRNIMDS